MGQRRKLDRDDLLAHARPHFRAILMSLGVPSDYLDGKEHPCPWCPNPGNTRFRYIDEDTGAVFCSHCFPTGCGDIFAAVMKAKGWVNRDFPKALEYVADFIGYRAGSEPPPPVEKNSDNTTEPADEATRDRVYRALLEAMPLDPMHLEQLLARKLSQEVIERDLYRSWRKEGNDWKAIRAATLAAGKDKWRIPGVSWKHGLLTRADGLIIPIRNELGQIVALQNRFDGENNDPKYAFVASKRCSAGAPVHVPLGITIPSPRVRVTEGVLKSNIAYHLSGLPTITSGAVHWKRLPEVLKRMGAEIVLLAFDADASDNKNVAGATQRAFEGLTEAGFEVKLESWDPADGKGIDDLLAGGKTAEVLDGFWAIEKLQEVNEAAEKAATEAAAQATSDLIGQAKAKIADGAEALFADKELLAALAALSHSDPAAFSIVKATVKKAKISTRDFDRAIKQHTPKKEKKEAEYDDVHGFCEVNGCLCMLVPGIEGELTPVELTNFVAHVLDETTRDDGVESKKFFGIDGTLQKLGKKLPRIEVSASSFLECDWIVGEWGSDAIVWPGHKFKVAPAIQALSKTKTHRTLFTHTGWRKIRDRWVYLHAGGAIGADPDDDISVDLRAPLSHYVLSDPSKIDVKAGVNACLQFLELTHAHITYPLLATAFRAAIGDSDFSTYLVGTTGIFKSELAALVQQFFGRDLDARNLPGNWSSTENALEQTAFLAKDAIYVIDDFAPTGSPGDIARLHRAADRIFRAQGNNQGRQRMNADGSLRPPKPPRAQVLSTGEEVPWGQSIRARLFIISLERGDITSKKLSERQKDAAAGLYVDAMSAFIDFIASSYTKIKSTWKSKVAAARLEAEASGNHARTPVVVAELYVAFRCFLHFAEQVGAITAEKREDLKTKCWSALTDTAGDQAAQQQVSEPAHHFMRMLCAALSSFKAHVAAMDGSPPELPNRWGWRAQERHTSIGTVLDWVPEGHRVGWTDGSFVYLEPEASYAEAQRLAREQGQSIALTPKTMHKRLKEGGYIALADDIRKTPTKRKTVEGNVRELLWIGLEHFSLELDPAVEPELLAEKAEQEAEEAAKYELPP